MAILNINELKDTVQDCNINFLIGSGMSAEYLSPLGSIETLLTELDDKKELGEEKRKLIKVSLYKKYFDEVISKNIEILEEAKDTIDVLNNYKNFLKTLNSILLHRKSTILSKQINIFTTNVDIFLEKALEDMRVEYNDGFNGRFNPVFDSSNLKKSYFKRSLHYDNISELPVFNLLKVHGSLTWKTEEKNKRIIFLPNLNIVRNVKAKVISEDKIIKIENSETIDKLIAKSEGKMLDNSVIKFLTEYEKLSIVNPTKEKLKDTVLNETYYELLRMYSNELEKENTILFVMGFSFADEHIREITLRAANSNPTLIIYIITYDSKSKKDIESKIELSTIKYSNIKIIAPPQKENDRKEMEDEFKYNFQKIREEYFIKLLKEIGKEKTEKLV